MACRPFQLLIKPVGADCNLRCEYCFYLRAGELYDHPGRHIMAGPVLDRVVRGLLELRFPQSVFAWQGGEPTLAGQDFFERVIALQQRYGLPGQIVGNAFQTNGVLIDEEWCKLFRDYRFLVGLSIDGPQEYHDRYRVNLGGRGTWHKTMAAAELMRRHGVEFNILCVVNRDNVRLGADLLKWFVDQGFTYLQFIPCVERDHPLNVPPEAYGQFLCDTFDYWSREGAGRVFIRDFDGLLAMRAGQPGGLCTHGGRCNAYIVVEHNGDVYPCDFFVQREWNLGNVMETPLESFLEMAKYKQFAYQKDKVAACRGCTWRPVCHGGCQKDRLAGGALHDPSALCVAYKQFFPYAMPRLSTLAKRLERTSPQTASLRT